MEAVLRSAIMFAFLLLIFRVAGKRTTAELTPFDLILLLVISEATQQALLGDDFSMTNAFIVIASLVGFDIALSLLKQRWHLVERVADGVPLLLVVDGRPIDEHLRKARVDEDDILESARSTQGLASMGQIRFAVLERNGGISVVPAGGS